MAAWDYWLIRSPRSGSPCLIWYNERPLWPEVAFVRAKRHRPEWGRFLPIQSGFSEHHPGFSHSVPWPSNHIEAQMESPTRETMTLSTGGSLSFLTAGDQTKPALLLIHGFPSSSRTFRDVIPQLAELAFVVAPDMPGFGASEVLPEPSFEASAKAIKELLIKLVIGPRFIYLHDFGAPVGLRIAMDQPELVSGLIVQNANAHQSGFGPQWGPTMAFWTHPTKENAEQATAHLTYEGTRDQYVAGVPEDIAARIDPRSWEEDWRVMQLPGRLETQKALIADYGNYVSRFNAIAAYLKQHQPRALMVWGRHDSFFDLEETVSWMQDLPRMEAHIFDAGHFALETEGQRAATLMVDFILKNSSQ